MKKTFIVALLITTILSTVAYADGTVETSKDTIYDTETYLDMYTRDNNGIDEEDAKKALDTYEKIKKKMQDKKDKEEQLRLEQEQESLKLKQQEENRLREEKRLKEINNVEQFTGSANNGTIGSTVYTPTQFIDLIAETVQRVSTEYGMFASIGIANAMQESAFGNSHLAKEGNNLFGIKAYSTWTGKVVGQAPIEEDNGTRTPYRAYDSIEDSVRDFYELMQVDRYTPIRTATTVYDALKFHETGYAGDITKDSQLKRIIDLYDLTRYDTATAYSIDTASINGDTVAVREYVKPEMTREDIKQIIIKQIAGTN